MKSLFFFGLSAIFFIGMPVQAGEQRLSRLVESTLFDKLVRNEIWSTEISETNIKYTCTKCDQPISALLEVINPYTPEQHSTLSQRYLSERKIYCMHLVTRDNGRCLGTSATGWNTGLTGFRSEYEVANRREIEIVFFYNEQQFGQELIRTTIVIDDGTLLPNHVADLFRAHMAKLTVLY